MAALLLAVGVLVLPLFVLLGTPGGADAHSPPIAVSVAPAAFSPDGDGRSDVARISLRLWRATYVSATILDTGRSVRKLPPATMRAGNRAIVWDGRLDDGTVASFGRYHVRIAARGGDRHWRIVTVPVTVLPPPSPPVALEWPVTGEVTSGFGPRNGTMHDGIDVVAPSMEPIMASAAGRVRTAGYISGYGNTVIIDHADGRSTLYAHQAELAVSAGAKVEAGQVVGYVGQTGSTTTAHLHFELHDPRDVPVDPVPHLPAKPQ
ncbi:MAG TPA: peptidoglycan DD-metalloendopeptidase family protein [Vicinamibacterales bacterium]|nr:peptidoglycan DD-metalloendopeptidase family protein [Vicinamibacterales bacterium]